MNAATRLGVYAAALAALFGAAFVTADAVVPQSTVTDWTNEAKGHEMDNTNGASSDHDMASMGAVATLRGVTSAQGGYQLTPVTAPDVVGEGGALSFQVLDAEGQPETHFATSHDKELHLIIVRSDGTQFRHVHPTLAADGTWSLTWQWAEAGTYRVYTDFVPEGEDAQALTLTRTVEVAGQYSPVAASPTKSSTADGYTVEVVGDLVAGASSELTLSVSRDGEAVTTLEPYLGAFGHLVALREGDLAFLHVHPEGEEPLPGQESGPDIRFAAEVPTPGRYLLYLDFQVDGQVHSAPLVLDATSTTGQADHAEHTADTEPDEHSDTTSGDSHDH